MAGFSHGWLLLYRVEGETLPPERMQQPDFIPQLAALVSRLHNQPRTGYRLPLKAQADRHFHLTDKRRRTRSCCVSTATLCAKQSLSR